MKKSIKILLIVIAILVVVAVVVFATKGMSKPKSNLPEIASAENLTALVDSVYEGLEIEMPPVMSQALEVTDAETVKSFTGLDNGNDLEYVVASEPMMSSQAYSLVLAKVKDGVDADKIAKTMNENVNARKWICVTAEKVYTTSSGNVICLVMSSEQLAKPIYEKFKTLAGGIGEEFERTVVEPELPEDMLVY